MGKLFHHLLFQPGAHVTHEQLLALVDGELSRRKARSVQKHIEKCWQCRAKHENIQKVIHGFVDYSNEVVRPYMPPPPEGRHRFLVAAEQLVSESETQGLRMSIIPTLSLRTSRVLLFTVSAILILSVIIAGVLWHRRPEQYSQVLKQSEKAEQVETAKQGIEVQKVSISAGKEKFVRVLYRDLEKKKIQRHEPEGSDVSRVRDDLEHAGVSWNRPISISDYSAWRRSVRVKTDRIEESATGELKLTTEPVGSSIRESSITLRKSDLHPIVREVQFRDSPGIQVAELAYDILPESQVSASIFEPISPNQAVVDVQRTPKLALPTETALVTAELNAEMALMRLKATDGENVHVERAKHDVRVVGIVDTDDRKRELEASLRLTPLVHPDIKSIEQLEREDRGNPGSTSLLQVRPEDVEMSPLDRFVASEGITKEQGIELSRSLSQDSISIAREVLNLNEMKRKYLDANPGITDDNLRLYRILSQKHLDQLTEFITNEELELQKYVQASIPLASPQPPQSLPSLADKNRKLVAELISGSGSRPAKDILQDLVRVSAKLKEQTKAL